MARSKGSFHQAWSPKVDLQDSHGGRREWTPASWPLATTSASDKHNALPHNKENSLSRVLHTSLYYLNARITQLRALGWRIKVKSQDIYVIEQMVVISGCITMQGLRLWFLIGMLSVLNWGPEGQNTLLSEMSNNTGQRANMLAYRVPLRLERAPWDDVGVLDIGVWN